jgi:SsrA-binding protein
VSNSTIMIENRKVNHEYSLLQRYQAGMILTGTEVKSLRAGKANLNDAFCYLIRGELFIKNMFISEYKLGTISNHEPRRVRKLLLNRQELKKIEAKVKEKGFAVAPVRLYESERGFFKIEVALAQGRKAYSKREHVKEKDMKRDVDRELKSRKD